MSIYSPFYTQFLYIHASIQLFSEEGTNVRLAVETLEELDWCLDQLESLQTHKVSVDY